ncbi:hypothetical protein [Micromonospora sp. NPDC005220]|uniref:hypothetical protein n=1 Tax=Micromonospora sp. NPDC005220 TaxID=3155589 RepID=UPI00339E15A1
MSRGEEVQRVAVRTAIEIATAGLGLAGPVGALVAASIKPALELVAVREGRGMQNIADVVTGVREATGLSPEEFGQWAGSSDGRLMLATSAFQAANNTMHEGKVKALAAVLAEGINDDAKLDLSLLIVAALTDLEAAHIRVLDAMVNTNSDAHIAYPDVEGNRWPSSILEGRFPGLRSGIAPIMATLERQGLATRGAPVENFRGNQATTWLATHFGWECLRYLTSTSG